MHTISTLETDPLGTPPPEARPAATPADGRAVLDELHHLVEAGDLPALMRWSRHTAQRLTGRHDDDIVDPLIGALEGHPLVALPVIEALGATGDPRASAALTVLLTHTEPLVRSHAAWRLGDLPPLARAVPGLTDLLASGGMHTLHAHRTLAAWSERAGVDVESTLVRTLRATDDPAARARLVDLLGALPSPTAHQAVTRLAADRSEHAAARIAAVGAVGERAESNVDLLRRLAAEDGPVAAAAALALDRARHEPAVAPRPSAGLRIAQLVLAGRIDPGLSLGGRGDTGGVASLLVSLGDALSRHEDVAGVLTIGRGTHVDALADDRRSGDPAQAFAMLALGDPARPAPETSDLWEHYPAVRRELRRALAAGGDLDLVHLRMGDVGTLAGAELARQEGIPICFSAAADPHNVLRALHTQGQLDADRFLHMDRTQHVWFRARLVEDLTARADRLALFPRSEPGEVFDLLGLRRQEVAGRAAVVGEGIDLRLRDAAERLAVLRLDCDCEPEILTDVAAQVPVSRRGRPLLVSVGRLHPVKGMTRVVEAWAGSPLLHDRFNLVIVGGDLENPSPHERGVLDEIESILPADDPRREGLVLLGGRPRPEVATLLASADRGRPGWWAGDGIYVDGAMKEEFGLAVLEALAAGLTVVAPHGGPSTYVEHGDTGVLVASGEPLGAAVVAATSLTGADGRRERARAMVQERFSIETMADQLVQLYRPAGVAR